VSLFFSPDGEWIGFYAGDRLKKVSTRGGPSITLASFTDFMGATWGPNGTILAAVASREILAVPDGGESPGRWSIVPPPMSGAAFLTCSQAGRPFS
jgi:serine/threonine-protein kinase